MSFKTFTSVCAVLVIAVSVVGARPAAAQVDRATVTGAVHDASGAAVAGVTLTVTYPATGLARPATSNERGIFFVTGLPVGSAILRVEKDGFRPLRVDADLKVGETRTLDFSLEIAGVEAAVDVVAPAALVHNSAGVGAVLENRQVSQLPINGRNWGNLMALVPGAVDTGGNGSSIRFVGHGGDDNNFRIDGVDATSVRILPEQRARRARSVRRSHCSGISPESVRRHVRRANPP